MVDERQRQLRAESLARAQSAVASEGLDLTPEDVALLDRWAAGDLTGHQVDQELAARTGQTPSPVLEQPRPAGADSPVPQPGRSSSRFEWLRRRLGSLRSS